MEKRREVLIIITVSIILVILLGFAFYIMAKDFEKDIEGEVYVSEIIDGDTFKMNTGETIRLLCVDAPESDEEGYAEATEFLESLILYKEVRLEKAETLNQTDKYGRTLAFVYVNNLGKDVFINKLIISAGFSEIYEYGDESGECKERVG